MASRPAPALSPVTSNTREAHASGVISLPYPADSTVKFSPRAFYDRPDLAVAAGHLSDAERERRDRLSKAAQWYTSQGLTVTPVHFPLIRAKPSSQSSRAVCGLNSDGAWFQLEWTSPDDPVEAQDPLNWSLKMSKTFASRDNQDRMPVGITLTSVSGKNPVMTGYLRDPDCRAETPEQAEKLWSQAPWNIGVITGRQTGLIVLDIDVRSGGLESIQALRSVLDVFNTTLPESAQCHLDGTYSYFTSGLNPYQEEDLRGFHVYFRVNPDNDRLWHILHRIGVNALPGVEIKHKSGIVVAAPSMHATGAVYAFRDRSPVRTLSQSAVETLVTAVKATRDGADPSVFASPFTDVSSLNSGSTFSSLSSSVTPAGISSGGDLTWRDAGSPRDDPSFEGYWSRQVEHWLMTGSAAVQYGPGEHHDSLKPMLGALVRLVPPSDTLAWYYHERLTRDESWIPPLYLSLACELDEAVSLPEPWHKTEFHNMCGILRHAILNELSRLTWGTR